MEAGDESPTSLSMRGAILLTGILARQSLRAVNDNHEDVVGYSADGPYNAHATAFLYFNGKMRNLNLLLASGSGWYLEQANAINDADQITGVGIINGETHAFLLTP